MTSSWPFVGFYCLLLCPETPLWLTCVCVALANTNLLLLLYISGDGDDDGNWWVGSLLTLTIVGILPFRCTCDINWILSVIHMLDERMWRTTVNKMTSRWLFCTFSMFSDIRHMSHDSYSSVISFDFNFRCRMGRRIWILKVAWTFGVLFFLPLYRPRLLTWLALHAVIHPANHLLRLEKSPL